MDPKAHHVDCVRIAWFLSLHTSSTLDWILGYFFFFHFFFLSLFSVFSWIHAWAGSLLWAYSFLHVSNLGLKLARQLAWSHFVCKAFMTLLFRSIPAMDDRPLEERLQVADMDYLTFRSISIGFIVDVTLVLGGMMVGGKVLDHWLVNLLSLDILLDRILLYLCLLSTFVLSCSITYAPIKFWSLGQSSLGCRRPHPQL